MSAPGVRGVLVLVVASLALVGCGDGGSSQNGSNSETQNLPDLADCPGSTGLPAIGAEARTRRTVGVERTQAPEGRVRAEHGV